MSKQRSHGATIVGKSRQGSVIVDQNKRIAANLDQLLTGEEVEAILKVGRNWCAKDRIGPARIPHLKIGRGVRYRLADVQAFFASAVRDSTSDPGWRAA